MQYNTNTHNYIVNAGVRERVRESVCISNLIIHQLHSHIPVCLSLCDELISALSALFPLSTAPCRWWAACAREASAGPCVGIAQTCVRANPVSPAWTAPAPATPTPSPVPPAPTPLSAADGPGTNASRTVRDNRLACEESSLKGVIYIRLMKGSDGSMQNSFYTKSHNIKSCNMLNKMYLTGITVSLVL